MKEDLGYFFECVSDCSNARASSRTPFGPVLDAPGPVRRVGVEETRVSESVERIEVRGDSSSRWRARAVSLCKRALISVSFMFGGALSTLWSMNG